MATVKLWSDANELATVRAQLYAPDAEQRRRGVAHVAAWSMRGSVPLAIDATASLVDILLLLRPYAHHTLLSFLLKRAFSNSEAREAEWGASDMALRLALSMALVRFVNGFVDSKQGGQFALPVAMLAEQMGMPAAFVDLRHEATHSDLPSLPLLASAAQHALEWLRARYWESTAAAPPSTSSSSSSAEEAASVSSADAAALGLGADGHSELVESIISHINTTNKAVPKLEGVLRLRLSLAQVRTTLLPRLFQGDALFSTAAAASVKTRWLDLLQVLAKVFPRHFPKLLAASLMEYIDAHGHVVVGNEFAFSFFFFPFFFLNSQQLVVFATAALRFREIMLLFPDYFVTADVVAWCCKSPNLAKLQILRSLDSSSVSDTLVKLVESFVQTGTVAGDAPPSKTPLPQMLDDLDRQTRSVLDQLKRTTE